MNKLRKLAFVWENFGPMHHDRCEAVLAYLGPDCRVVGIELASESSTYVWDKATSVKYEHVTLFAGRSLRAVSFLERYLGSLRGCLRSQAEHVFLCHYESMSTFCLAVTLRLLGKSVFVMNDSKYDDYKRYLWREILKSLFYLPYSGGLASGIRSKDYLRFLGLPEKRIQGVYNALSLDRVRRNASIDHHATDFEDRYFIVVARLVEKKNLDAALDAYGMYRNSVPFPRNLKICGDGPLREALKAKVRKMGLEANVSFEGHLSAERVATRLKHALAMLLPSIEEQFGNVAIEAQALCIPVILSDNCGARDDLVRTGVNGFVVEPYNAEGMAFFMGLLHDEALWNRMSVAAGRFSHLGDAQRFAEAVSSLTVQPASNE